MAQIDERLRRIAAWAPDHAEDLDRLRQLGEIDRASALNKVRYIAERVLQQLCREHSISWGRGEPTLESMMGPLVARKVLPRHVAIHVRTIQTNASPGSHFQEVPLGASHLDIARLALANLLEWHVGVRESVLPGRPDVRRLPAWVVPVAVVALLLAAASVWWLRSRGTAEEPAPAAATPSPVLPPDGSVASVTPVELRWEEGKGGAPSGWEVEFGRIAPEADAAPRVLRLPAGVSYVMWPWVGAAPEPGTYQWRVRPSEGPWSSWRTFSFFRSMLDRVQATRVLRIGMEPTFHPPFVAMDPERNELTGFDVELAALLAERLGARPERVTREWAALFEGIRTHELDVVVSAVSVTDERRRSFGFSRPYVETGQVLVALSRDATDFTATAAVRTLGAQAGTTSAALARSSYPAAALHEYDTLDATFAALARGEIQALMCDDVLARSRPEVLDGTMRIATPLLNDESYAVLLPAGDEPLRLRIDEVLAALEADGTLERLRVKYLRPANQSVPPPPGYSNRGSTILPMKSRAPE